MSEKITGGPAVKLKKPGYSTTKFGMAMTWLMSWVVVMMLIHAGAYLDKPQATGLASIAIPSMVALIVAVLGIHRAFGSIDMRTIAQAHAASASAAEDNDDKGGEQ